MNCTGEESMLIYCGSVYENSTAGCNRRAAVQCHEESEFISMLLSFTVAS